MTSKQRISITFVPAGQRNVDAKRGCKLKPTSPLHGAKEGEKE